MLFVADRADRLDKFLAAMLPQFSRSKLAKLIEKGMVLVDGEVEKPSFQLAPGMEIELEAPEASEPHDLTPADIPLDIVYEDSDLLVVDKPRGLASHPAISLKEPSLVNALLFRTKELSQAGGAWRPGIVHRLDKDTTGLMVVAKNDEAHVQLAKQIELKTAERRYFAIVAGRPEQERFLIKAPIGRDKRDRIKMTVDPLGKEAQTEVKIIASTPEGTLVGAKLTTGRTHQIRVHLRAVGLPVFGDSTYSPAEVGEGPLQLHAGYLAFDQPRSGQRIVTYVAPPDDFRLRAFATRESLEDF